jgi:hypothetical protein
MGIEFPCAPAVLSYDTRIVPNDSMAKPTANLLMEIHICPLLLTVEALSIWPHFTIAKREGQHEPDDAYTLPGNIINLRESNCKLIMVLVLDQCPGLRPGM